MPSPFMRANLRTSKKPQDRTEAIPPIPEHQYEDDNNPYRGIERHGVPKQYDPQFPPDYDDEVSVDYEDEPNEPDPIPVIVVSAGGREQKRFRSMTVSVPGKDNGNMAMLIGAERNRTRILINNATVATHLYIADRPYPADSAPIYSYDMASGEKLELHTTEAIYACTDQTAQNIRINMIIEYGLAVE